MIVTHSSENSSRVSTATDAVEGAACAGAGGAGAGAEGGGDSGASTIVSVSESETVQALTKN